MNTISFKSLIPELSVTDIEASRRFYVDILGFVICYERPEDRFIFIEYESNQLMLEQINGNWNTGALEYPFGRGINFEMTVSDVGLLYDRVLVNGIKPFVEMERKTYKCGEESVAQRQFLVQDPDGYLLRFVE